MYVCMYVILYKYMFVYENETWFVSHFQAFIVRNFQKRSQDNRITFRVAVPQKPSKLLDEIKTK